MDQIIADLIERVKWLERHVLDLELRLVVNPYPVNPYPGCPNRPATPYQPWGSRTADYYSK